MIENILLGAGYAFAAGVQPGPLQAFLFSRVATAGWKGTLPAALAPLLSDVPIVLIVLVVLGQLPPFVQQVLRAAGGALLVYLAWRTLRTWRAELDAGSPDGVSAPRTLLQAVLVNVLNPNPYMGWALVLGPAVITAWRSHPENAVALLVAFYGTLVATLGASIILFGTAGVLSPRARHALIGVSALVLAAIGAYQMVVAIVGLRRT